MGRRWAARALVAGVVVGTACLVAVPSAVAAVSFTVYSTFPSPVTVGATGLAGQLTISNNSTSPESTSPVTLTAIDLVPSCGSTTAPGGVCQSADPGVFQLSGTGTGEAGTGCPGTTFTTSIVDSNTGEVSFAPATPVTLAASGPMTAECVIDFTLSVLKAPTKDASTGSAGLQTAQISSVSGTATSDSVTGLSTASAITTVNKAATALSAQASGTTALGNSISDTASLSGGASPTGTITFKAYGASDASCSQPPVATLTATVSGNGNYSSGPYTPTTVGTYHWIASYGGDATNATAGPTSCTATGSSVVVTQAVTTITAQASGSVGLGGVLTDSATLAGGVGAGGTVTFHAYGPDDSTCGDAAAYTATAVVNGNGTYGSGSFTPTRTGTYRWTATYGGDPNNLGSTTSCNAANQSATVLTTTATTITTQASATVVVGGLISDTATLSGGASPTGTITFNAYGPGDTSCSKTPAFTASKSVSGNGAVSSGTFTAATAGTYRWIASYSGDTSNAPSSTNCNDANSTTTVSQAAPTITNQASGTVSVGSTVSDTATLSGGVGPTGTITFNAYGPGDTSCSKTPAFTATKTVSGNGAVSSGTFTAATVGTYRWIATYGGDTNNTGIATSCNDAHSTTAVSQATPTIANQASGSVLVGGTVSDTATLSGGVSPTGTITFNLYGPGDASCTTTPAFTATKSVNGNGAVSSGSFSPTSTGTYRWVAAYGGDTNNAAAATSCNDPNGSVTVSAPSATSLTSQATGTATLGSPISDTATLSGGASPTGTITFNAYGPGDTSCSDTPAFTATKSVSGNGAVSSGTFNPATAGTYRWIASYSGDTNNTGAATSCNDAHSTTTVSQATPTITNQASGTVSVGSTVSDTATLSGGASPTGTITFNAYGPGDTSCSDTPAFTATKTVTGNGDLSSGPFSPTTSGSYRWIATYGGDTNNAGAATSCNDPDGSVTVLAPSVTSLTSQATGAIALGSPTSDQASLAGGDDPTGVITFDVYGPADTSCARSPAFTSTATVSGDGDYPSGSFTPTAAGTYHWVAAYGGDGSNDPSATDCDDAGSTTVVSPATSTVALKMSAATAKYGDERTEQLTVTVPATSSDPTPTGTVKVSESTTTLCSVTLTAGTGSCRLANSQLHAGSYHLVARFAGDADSGTATSASKSLEIAKATSKLALTLTHKALHSGHEQVERLSISTSGSVPSGHVTIKAAAKTICTISLKAGKGSCRLSKNKLRAGKYTLVAHYSGNANFTAATSAKKLLRVHKKKK